MKTLILTALVLTATLGTAVAQEPVEQQLSVTGEINYVVHPQLPDFQGPVETPMSFVFTVTEDITDPQPYLSWNPPYYGYNNVTIVLDFELFDAQDNSIFSVTQSTLVPEDGVYDRIALFSEILNATPEQSAVWAMIGTSSQTNTTLRSEFVLGQNAYRARMTPYPQASGSLFTTMTPYPIVDTSVTSYPFQYTGTLGGQLFYFEGTANYLSYDGLDFDGDGVANAGDLCSESLLDETAIFKGWYDSGVTNYVDADGCSVMDHYAACEAEEQEAPRRGIRSVRSGPSNCEKAVSYDLVADGVISYAEARMLRNALYNSYSTMERR